MLNRDQQLESRRRGLAAAYQALSSERRMQGAADVLGPFVEGFLDGSGLVFGTMTSPEQAIAAFDEAAQRLRQIFGREQTP